MREVFDEMAHQELAGYIVWTPMLSEDDRQAAERGATAIQDHRIRHYWDPRRGMGKALSKTLALTVRVAWDVYLVYPPGARWYSEFPPLPAVWMHQLDEDPAHRLDPELLRREVVALIPD